MLNNWNINITQFDFFQPNWLWLLLFLPVLGWFLWRKENRRVGDWKFSGTTNVQRKFEFKPIIYVRQFLILAKLLVFALLVIALAKPFRWNDKDAQIEDYKYGIDIMLAIDVSLSMLATDFNPNRLDAAKEVAKEFIDGRKGDRIGLVVYSGEAYAACPATLDYEVLKAQIDAVDGFSMQPGTAIGTGLGTAVVQLRSDSLKSKVIILLTDGINNEGEISPVQAAELAKAKNICVYTIGVGSQGVAPTPIVTPMGVRYENQPVEIDEATLLQVAETTGGQYFRAKDEKSLKSIYKQIEALEKRKMVDKHYQSEPPATPAVFLNWALLILTIIIIIEHGFFVNND